MIVADLRPPSACKACDSRRKPRPNSECPDSELDSGCWAEHGSSCVGMNPVAEFLLLVVGQDVIYLETLGPGIDQPFFRTPEIIFDVALTAYEGAHLLAGGLLVDVVVLNALGTPQGANAFDESRTSDAKLHRRVVTVDTGVGCETSLRASVGHLIH